MTKIILGTGDDAIEVEDGASVPILQHVPGRSARGTVHVVAGAPVVRWGCDGEEYVAMCRDSRLMAPVIDLAALRRERAPKIETVGGWSLLNQVPVGFDIKIGAARRHIDVERTCYWTHRAGNTPEKQAAFDAALDAWVVEFEKEGIHPMSKLVLDAARALGYGRSPVGDRHGS